MKAAKYIGYSMILFGAFYLWNIGSVFMIAGVIIGIVADILEIRISYLASKPRGGGGE